MNDFVDRLRETADKSNNTHLSYPEENRGRRTTQWDASTLILICDVLEAAEKLSRYVRWNSYSRNEPYLPGYEDVVDTLQALKAHVEGTWPAKN